jgi:asparagine synthase (glutamine-hydrolysing)
MCGIVGLIDLGQIHIDAGELLEMNRAIAHRGPDDEGFVLINQTSSVFRAYSGVDSPPEVQHQIPRLTPSETSFGANIGLGHRRFSIIDLSPGGHQPFFDREKSCCLVFNGEIYNFVELRAELEQQGLKFKSHSDTEVLLAAYKHWGTDCFARLNGFWAIALYDFAKKRLLVSRDRLGKKPLYWTKAEGRIYFASEIKSLLQVPAVYRHRQVNERSIFLWLAYGMRDLDFSTCFEGINSLPAGCWAALNEEFPQNAKVFWSVPNERMGEGDISQDEAVKDLRAIMLDSVRIRLRADVPLALSLSGGMDSSAVVALAAQIHRDQITTYTVRFPEEDCNEEPFARSVAKHYKVDYRVLESPTENFWLQILPFTYLQEEPYHSPNQQTHQVIWAQMRAAGTKVALNGGAGDENFGGYGWYFDFAQRDHLLNGRFRQYWNNAVYSSESNSKAEALLAPFLSLAKESAKAILPGSWIEKRRRNQLSYFTGAHHQGPANPKNLCEALRSHMTNTLMPYWLRSGERGFMGIPLEERSPLLDYRIVDLAFRLPETYLIRDGWRKWILRKCVEDLLPAEVVWRKRKMGMPYPYARFRKRSQPILDEIFSRSKNPYLDFSKKDLFQHDWRMISFILWYELFFNENMELFTAIQQLARQQESLVDYGFVPEFLRTCENAGRDWQVLNA